MSSSRRYQQNTYYNNAQPVQQQIYSSAVNQQMPFNEFYSHNNITMANENNIYSSSRPMATYGNGAETLNNRRFNPDAPAFQPRGFYQAPQQQQSQSTTAYGGPYSAYMQPVSQVQQIRSIPQQQQALYDPNAAARMYTPSHHIQQSHSPIQQQPKYPQMSQNAQQSAYTLASQEQMMPAYQQQNGLNDYQQQQMSQNEAAYGGGQFAQFPISDELTNSIQNSNNRMAIIEVQIGLEQLVAEPHEFELWGNAIKARVSSGVSKDDAQLIAWLLVEHSYLGTNAQYSFARLCKLLDSEIKSFTVQYAIPRIAYFMGSNSVAALSPEHLSNFISFLAELYDKTEVNKVRISRLGQYIISQICVQLSGEKLNDQIVKNIVQVLKLTGRHIEEDQDPEQLKQVFQQLDTLQKSCTDISSAVKNNIRQLNLLRERNWGVTKNEDFMNGSSMNGSHHSNSQGEGTFYGPDGQPISEEERLFLEESCRAVEASYPEMDADSMAAYENFLQDQTEETAFNVAARALERLSIDEDLVSPQRKNLPV